MYLLWSSHCKEQENSPFYGPDCLHNCQGANLDEHFYHFIQYLVTLQAPHQPAINQLVVPSLEFPAQWLLDPSCYQLRSRRRQQKLI